MKSIPQTIIRLSPALKARAQAYCRQSEATLSFNALMRLALVDWLDRHQVKARTSARE